MGKVDRFIGGEIGEIARGEISWRKSAKRIQNTRAIRAHFEAHSLGYGHGNVVDRKSAFPEQILSHVRESSGRIDGIPTHSIAFQIGSGITTLE